MTPERFREALAEEFSGARLRRSALLALSGLLPRVAFARSRTQLVRWAGVEVGTGTVLAGKLRVTGTAGTLRIGERCFLNSGCHIDVSAPVTIGDSVSLAQDVLILTNTHELGPASRRAGALRNEAVTIGDGCWLGARAVVLPGVTIGAGSIVAAGAVVTRDVAPDSLVGGVPAALIRPLSSEPARSVSPGSTGS